MKCRIQLLLIFFSSLCFSSVYASNDAESIEELNQRIQELEDYLFDLEDRVGSTGLVKPSLSPELTLGGFYQGVYNYSSSKDSYSHGLDLSAVYLTGEAKLGERWRFNFAQLFGQYALPSYASTNGFIRLKNLTSRSSQLNESLYANVAYNYSDALKLVMGRQRAPVGIVSREFFPLSFLYSGIPDYLSNAAGSGDIFPSYIDGVSASGKYFLPNQDIVSYNVAVGTAADLDTSLAGLNGLSVIKNTGTDYIARLAYGVASQAFEVGLNYVSGTRDLRTISIPATDTFDPANPVTFSIPYSYGGNDFETIGVDLYVNKNNVQLKLEYFETSEKGQDDRKAYYIEPAWHLSNKIDVYLRNELYDIPQFSSQQIADAIAEIFPGGAGGFIVPAFEPSIPFLGEVEVNVVGLRYKPYQTVHLKVGAGQREFKDLPKGNREMDFYYLSVVAGF